MITYRPNFIEPVVLEKIERDRLVKEKETYNKPMEISIQKFNPNYHFADFEYVSVPTISPHREGIANHNVLDMDITAHNNAKYYKNKIPEFLPKITTTIKTTPTTSITTTTRIEISSTIEKIYLKYDKENDTWEDITLTYKIMCDKIQIYNWINNMDPEHGYW